jgi:ribosomal protein S6--L-glutamate ligase
VALGGRPESFEPDAGLVDLALRASNAVGAVAAGVDLLLDLDRGGHVVIEVNAVPGWRALAGATGRDIAAEILDELRGRGR